MFQNLTDKFLGAITKVRGQSKISEANIDEAVKEIRLSLLEADVNFKVVKNFIDRVKAQALGQNVIQNVNPGQMFTKIIFDELVKTLGGEKVDVNVSARPAVIFLVGLQGAGKTTSTAKLALFLRQKLKKTVGLVSVDVYRPAAIEQLQILAKQNNFSLYPSSPLESPPKILQGALDWQKSEGLDVLLVDTAGRLQIDEELMGELEALKAMARPGEILLVADAMLGQQSVNVAEGFHKRLGLSGLVLTKVDGDARGGAALSIREVTGIPIKFLGLGEKVAALEVFHPDRLAQRILDMGDVLTLVEKAQEVFDAKEAEISAQKMLKNKFTLEDFLLQIQQLKKLGGMESLMKFLPGMGGLSQQLKSMTPPDEEMKRLEAIIRSMTPIERKNHKILNGSRRERIAKGSGTRVQDVNRLVKQFEEAQKMMGSFMKMGMPGKGNSSGFPPPRGPWRR